MAKQLHIENKHKQTFIDSGGFQNRHNRRSEDEIKALEEEIRKAEEGVEVEGDLDTGTNESEGDPTPETPPVETSSDPFEKRYKELQSFATKRENELKEEIQALKETISSQENKVVYPVSDEELEEWMEKYPDVVKNLETLILKKLEGTKSEFNETIKGLRKEKAELAKERAYTQLMKIHPDFNEVIESDGWKAWFSEQPQSLQDAISKAAYTEAGVKSAARVIDIFKKETETPKKKDTSETKEAAKSVRKSSSESPSTTGGKKVWRESEVKSLTPQQYEKNAEEIQAALAEGRFEYDVSAAS